MLLSAIKPSDKLAVFTLICGHRTAVDCNPAKSGNIFPFKFTTDTSNYVYGVNDFNPLTPRQMAATVTTKIYIHLMQIGYNSFEISFVPEPFANGP